MCTSPVHIKNTTKSIKFGYTKENIVVPCGCCDECRSQKSEDWFQRIYYMIDTYNKAGGRVAFVTLTYNDEHIPMFTYEHDDGSVRSFPCFSKDNIDDYKRHLNDYFRYHADYSPKNCKLPFASIIGAEYGFHGTQRSHHHGLFFIPPELIKVFGDSEFFWKPLFRNWWQKDKNFGFVNFSKQGLWTTKEYAGIYTSKYMLKDIGFYAQPGVEDYFAQANDENGVRDKERYKQLYHDVYSYLPHHYQSPHFGAGLVEIFDNYEVYRDGFDYGLKSEIENGKVYRHKCPKYIERKLLYYQDENRSYKLNEKGIEWTVRKEIENLPNNVDKLLEVTDINKLRAYICYNDIINNKALKDYESLENIHKFITSILFNREICEEIYLYGLVWRGSYTRHISDIVKLDYASHDEFVNLSWQHFYDSKRMPVDAYDDEGYFRKWSYETDHSYSDYTNCRRFIGFDEFLSVYNAVKHIYHWRSHKLYLEQRDERIRLKFVS